MLLRAPRKPPQTAALFIFGSTTSVNKHDQFLCDPELAGVCGLWQSFFQLTMFTGKLSDVLCGGVGGGVRFGRPGLSEYCRWHRSDRSAASCGSETPRDCQLHQGGREEDLVVLRRGLISDLKENYTTIIWSQNPSKDKWQATLFSFYLWYYFSPHAFLCVSGPCSPGVVSMSYQAAERGLALSGFISFSLLNSDFILFESPFSSWLSKVWAHLLFFPPSILYFSFSLISLSLLDIQTPKKPLLQFSRYRYLVSNDPSASLSCSLH